MNEMEPPPLEEFIISWEETAILASYYSARQNWISASKEFHPRSCECSEETGILFSWAIGFMEEAKNSTNMY